MHAIFETGGKQYKVAEGDCIFIEKLDANEAENVTFSNVLAILGDTATFGAPTVAGASVTATVLKNGKGKKIRIFKYTPKKGYRKRQGHRQPYTKIQINSIKV
ncbi:MAG: 50S ribosomal protein L21 [Eubacteriales bacterium]